MTGSRTAGPGAGTGPPEVGDRIVVRYLTADGSATDVLGALVGVDESTLRVRPDRRAGEPEVVVPRARVIAAKPVPPRTRRPAEIDALERVMADHWRAPDAERLGGEAGWLLRSADGFTNRANSALVIGDPGLPLREALDAVRAWYDARGLTPRLAVPAFEAPRWDPLRAAGWAAVPGAGARVHVASVADLLGRAAAIDATAADLPITWTSEPDDDWLAGYHYRGQELAPIGRRLLTSAPEQGFGSVRGEDRATIAVLRLSAANGWAGITAVEVDPARRRRGIGSGLVHAAARWASQRGLQHLFLQVGVDNRAARRLYVRAGFTEHHTYDYVIPAG